MCPILALGRPGRPCVEAGALLECLYMPFRTPAEIGGIYHVINRGVDKRNIFLKPQDYARFILGLYFFNDRKGSDIWTSLKNKEQEISTILGRPDRPIRDERKRIVDLLAFVLMPNHYHLIIREIEEGGISTFMQKMGGYSWYFNKQNERVGSLFQGRYKAVRIRDDTQLSNVFVYVHTNPVELKDPEWKDFKVKNAKNAIYWLENYRWSSFHDYMGRLTFPMVTQRDFFLKYYGGEKNCQRAVEDWIKFKAENAQLGPEIIE